MRKLVVLLAIVALVSGLTAVLAGCRSTAPTAQPATAPMEATLPLQDPTTEPAPLVDDSVSTPTPASSADDGLEFAPADSFGSSKKQEPITDVDTDSPQKGDPGATGPVQGDAYTLAGWRQDNDGAASNRPSSRERLRRIAS